jgi:hypothetical protein
VVIPGEAATEEYELRRAERVAQATEQQHTAAAQRAAAAADDAAHRQVELERLTAARVQAARDARAAEVAAQEAAAAQQRADETADADDAAYTTMAANNLVSALLADTHNPDDPSDYGSPSQLDQFAHILGQDSDDDDIWDEGYRLGA